jgi:hypothetical protein
MLIDLDDGLVDIVGGTRYNHYVYGRDPTRRNSKIRLNACPSSDNDPYF